MDRVVRWVVVAIAVLAVATTVVPTVRLFTSVLPHLALPRCPEVNADGDCRLIDGAGVGPAWWMTIPALSRSATGFTSMRERVRCPVACPGVVGRSSVLGAASSHAWGCTPEHRRERKRPGHGGRDAAEAV